MLAVFQLLNHLTPRRIAVSGSYPACWFRVLITETHWQNHVVHHEFNQRSIRPTKKSNKELKTLSSFFLSFFFFCSNFSVVVQTYPDQIRSSFSFFLSFLFFSFLFIFHFFFFFRLRFWWYFLKKQWYSFNKVTAYTEISFSLFVFINFLILFFFF